MADPRLKEIGTVKDRDGFRLAVCAEDGMVRLDVGASIVLLPQAAAGEFAQLYVAACWQAARMPP